MDRILNQSINLSLADNGILVDWGDGRREIVGESFEEMSRLLEKIAGFLEGYYGAAFETHTIKINHQVNERFDGPEGIGNPDSYT